MEMKEYIRDKRSPIPKNRTVSKVMSSNKPTDTKPELIVRKELRKRGLTGYRLHCKKISGKPDICYISKKIAIFINGCFWHRCPICKLPLPKTNQEFWTKKFNNNIERDRKRIEELRNIGWTVHVLWECQINSNVDELIDFVEKEFKMISH